MNGQDPNQAHPTGAGAVASDPDTGAIAAPVTAEATDANEAPAPHYDISGPTSSERRDGITNHQTEWLDDRGGWTPADVDPALPQLEVGVRSRTPNADTKSGFSNHKAHIGYVFDDESTVDESYEWLARYGIGTICNKLTIALRKLDPAGKELDANQVLRESELLAYFGLPTMQELIKALAPWETKGRKKASAATAAALAACAVDDQREARIEYASTTLASFFQSILNNPSLQLTAPEQASELKAYLFLVKFIEANKMKGTKPKSKVLGEMLGHVKALANSLRKTVTTLQSDGVSEGLQSKIEALETLDFLLCGGDQLEIELVDFEERAAEKRAKKAAAEGGSTEASIDDLISGL